MTRTPTSYFLAQGDSTYVPTLHAGSAWGDDGLHFSPVAGLLVHHLEQQRTASGDADKVVGRISFDILGRLADDEISIRTRLVRPGRTIELWETTASIQGRDVIAARAWALSALDTRGVVGVEFDALSVPAEQPLFAMNEIWPGGYINSIEARKVCDPRPGRGAAWITTPHELVAGERAGTLASYVALIDTANGVAVRERPEDCMFPNLDLTVHFFRQPHGHWVGLDTRVSFGPTGQGLTSSVLHDESGPVGTAQQLLTVRPQGGTPA